MDYHENYQIFIIVTIILPHDGQHFRSHYRPFYNRICIIAIHMYKYETSKRKARQGTHERLFRSKQSHDGCLRGGGHGSQHGVLDNGGML